MTEDQTPDTTKQLVQSANESLKKLSERGVHFQPVSEVPQGQRPPMGGAPIEAAPTADAGSAQPAGGQPASTEPAASGNE